MMSMTPQFDTTLAFGLPGGWEWIVLVILGLLIFGRRLPEVGRNFGRSIVEFKRGIKGISDEIEEESSRASAGDSQKQMAEDQKKDALPHASTHAGQQAATAGASQSTENG